MIIRIPQMVIIVNRTRRSSPRAAPAPRPPRSAGSGAARRGRRRRPVFVCVYMYIHTYIYIYRERERYRYMYVYMCMRLWKTRDGVSGLARDLYSLQALLSLTGDGVASGTESGLGPTKGCEETSGDIAQISPPRCRPRLGRWCPGETLCAPRWPPPPRPPPRRPPPAARSARLPPAGGRAGPRASSRGPMRASRTRHGGRGGPRWNSPTRIRGNHLYNTTCLTHGFFKSD